jgi:hypothetical protein
MFRRAMSPNHNAPNTAFVPGDRLLFGGLRHVPFGVLTCLAVHPCCTNSMPFVQVYSGCPHALGRTVLVAVQSERKPGWTYETATAAYLSAQHMIVKWRQANIKRIPSELLRPMAG